MKYRMMNKAFVTAIVSAATTLKLPRWMYAIPTVAASRSISNAKTE
jgi:hypothetical protein